MERRKSENEHRRPKSAEAKFENAKIELKKTDAHGLMVKTVRTHYVSSINLRWGVMEAIKKIAPEIENNLIRTKAVTENFKNLLINECRISKTQEGFVVTKEVNWLIANLKSIDLNSKKNPVSKTEAHILNEIIKSLESDVSKQKTKL